MAVSPKHILNRMSEGVLALRKEGCRMVTYADLFQFCILIVGICGLIYQICKKK